MAAHISVIQRSWTSVITAKLTSVKYGHTSTADVYIVFASYLKKAHSSAYIDETQDKHWSKYREEIDWPDR